MGTEIKVWQVRDKALVPLEQTMAAAGRKETVDLEEWILSEPAILGDDIVIIGSQIQTRSGPLDLLGIDFAGNTVIVELKRDMIPREAVAQAIDYASDVAAWDVARLGEECLKFRQQPLDDYLLENLPDEVALDALLLNRSQRVLLVGTAIEESLQRMIEWLSGTYQMPVNALLLRYIRTESGEELVARTMVIPEEVERQAAKQRRGFQMDDTPGTFEDEELREQLTAYLREDRPTPRRIRTVLLPLCLDHQPVSREEIKQRLIAQEEAESETQAGHVLSTISRELGMPTRAYLRQVIRYQKPEEWLKDNYCIDDTHKELVKGVLAELTAEVSAS
ncbi:endonuclease NucS [bacterium]|nr:endonuclease NucS [bacterium]